MQITLPVPCVPSPGAHDDWKRCTPLFERDIANQFWHFVRGRAIDPRSNPYRDRVGSQTLEAIEYERTHIADYLSGDDLTVLLDNTMIPWTYPTLQEALIAFLVHQASLNEFPYPYEMWLRTVVLIVSDVQRDPEWLHVVACDWEPVP